MVYLCWFCAKKPPPPQPASPRVAAPAISTKSALSSVRGIRANLRRIRLLLSSGNRKTAALMGSSGARIGEEGGRFAAVDATVLIARLNDVAALPEAMPVGVKTAVAPRGSPEAVSVIGAFRTPA